MGAQHLDAVLSGGLGRVPRTRPDRRQVWVEGTPQTLPQGGQGGVPWPG